MVDGFDGLGHDAVVGSNHQNGNVSGLCATGTHGSKGGVAGGIQESDHIAVHIHGVSTDVLGNAASLAGGDGGLTDGVQSGGLTMVNVTHDNHNGSASDQLISGILVILDQALFDGDGDFLFHLAAQFGGHKFCGVKVDGLVDAGHNAVLHQQLDDLAGGLLHPAGQFANGDFLGNLNGQRSLACNLHLQTAELLLLLVAGLVALELVVLLLLLLTLLAAKLLLAALVILLSLGDQIVHIGKAVGVHLNSGCVNHTTLTLALRLSGLDGLLLSLGSSILLLGLVCSGLLLSLGCFCLGSFLNGLSLGSGGLGLDSEHNLQRGDLVVLGQIIENNVQLNVRQCLCGGLGLFTVFGKDFGNILIGTAKICRHFFHTILRLNTHI